MSAKEDRERYLNRDRSDPVFQDGKKWFFWNPIGTYFEGPFETEEEARTMLVKWQEWINNYQ